MDIPTDTPSSPRPFVEVLGLWLQVLKMDEAFFSGEGRRASRANTLYAVLILAIFGVVESLMKKVMAGPALFERITAIYPWVRFMPIISLILSPILFYIYTGMVHWVALPLKGTGRFTVLAYLCSLFTIPLGIASSALGFIPYAGGLIELGIAVYTYILTIRVLRAIYGLNTKKALAAIFVPMLVIVFILFPMGLITAFIFK
jgi:hypothetical protein